jgi:uncharacterized protein YecE (DUF72 family)
MWEGVVTTDLVYVRLHGHEATYSSPYPDRVLRGWAERVRGWLDAGHSVHVYFDNTDLGHAVDNASTLAHLVAGGTGTDAGHA